MQFFAQAVDVDVYRARPSIAVQAPDPLIQGLAVEQLPPGTDKGQQQIKLPGRQLYAGAVLGDDVVVRVDDGIESLQCGGPAAGVAQQAFHPGQQLRRGKGLDDVVIRAQPQPAHPVLHRGFGC